jgi:hypothetical protein
VLFFQEIWMHCTIPKIAVENPSGVYSKFERSDQVIEPYFFGHPMTKKTHLWLKGLPPLMYTNIVADPFVNWTKYKGGGHNGKDRSRTFKGIASAMAQQWGGVV